MKVDLHSHTSFSPDSTTSPAVLVERAREVGLDRVAVTDHGDIEGAVLARSLDPELVIVGEEIRCRDRTELIGLFLRERVPMRLPVEETAERIRDQGGLVYVPHPFAYLTRPSRRARRAMEVADVIEAYNSRAFWPAWNRRAREHGRRDGVAVGAGSDAHFPWELGQAWTEIPAFRTREEFRSVLPEARAVGVAKSPAAVHLASAALKLAQRLVALPEVLPRPAASGLSSEHPPRVEATG